MHVGVHMLRVVCVQAEVLLAPVTLPAQPCHRHYHHHHSPPTSPRTHTHAPPRRRQDPLAQHHRAAQAGGAQVAGRVPAHRVLHWDVLHDPVRARVLKAGPHARDRGRARAVAVARADARHHQRHPRGPRGQRVCRRAGHHAGRHTQALGAAASAPPRCFPAAFARCPPRHFMRRTVPAAKRVQRTCLARCHPACFVLPPPLPW